MHHGTSSFVAVSLSTASSTLLALALPAFGTAALLLNRPQKLVAGAAGPTLQGALQVIAGPERIETGWWDGEPVSRDYFVAVNPAGETCWIYRERRGDAYPAEPGRRATARWFLHGIFR